MRPLRGAAVAVALVAFARCSCEDLGVSGLMFACQADAECGAGFVCAAHLCAPASSVDAGPAANGDGGADAGLDAGVDGGADAGPDAGIDGGGDAGGTDGGGAALVQEATAGSSGGANSLTAVFPAPVGAGHALIACISFDTSISDVASVTGGGVSWTRAALGGGGAARTAVYYGLRSDGGADPVKVTFSGSDDSAFEVSEWSGIAALDGTVSMGATGATVLQAGATVSTGSLATGTAPDLLFACGAQDLSAVATGPFPGSFTALTPVTPGGDMQQEAYLLDAGPGTYAASWTVGASAGNEWCGILAGFTLGP